MIGKILTASLASAAMALASAAVAGPPGGGHATGGGMGSMQMGGPSAAGMNARANSQGMLNASPQGIANSSMNSALQTTTTMPTTQTMPGSQALQHASPTGIAHANSHSVLASGSVAAGTLPDLMGQTILNSAGTTLGTVTNVVTGTDGSIRLYVVTNSSTGQTYRLPASSITVSGSTYTTTSM